MTDRDKQRWDERYDGRDPVAFGVAPDALVEAGLVDDIAKSGRALDVACGLGAQSVWLAQRGLDVTAIDVSGEAATRVVAATSDHDLGDRIDTRVIDVDQGLPNDGAYDVIVCQRFRAPHLYDAFVDRLVVGGISIITVLSAVGAAQPGEFHAPPGELAHAFDRADVDVLFSAEADGESSIIVRRIA